MHEPERGEQVSYGCLSAARRARLCKALYARVRNDLNTCTPPRL